MKQEVSWHALKDVCQHYGMTYESALNAVKANRFPVPTYKLGRKVVVDKVVHETFFKNQREAGLCALNNNKSES